MFKKNLLTKKSIGAILAITCAVTSYSYIQINASTKNEEIDVKTIVTEQDWKDVKDNDYPIDTDSQEWEKISLEDAQKACDMPSDMLNEYSTEELTEYVLKYPLLVDMMGFDRVADGIEHLKATSNIIEEFFSRDDNLDHLLEAYDNLSVDYEMLSDESNNNSLKDSDYQKELFLQGCLAMEYNELDQEQVARLADILGEKYDEKIEADAVSDCIEPFLFYEVLQEENGTVPEEAIPENIYEDMSSGDIADGGVLAGYTPGDKEYITPIARYNIGKYTKYKKTVGCLKWLSGDYSVAKKKALNDAVLDAHPSWSFIAYATPRCNCHSYAWISNSINNYWLNNPDVFAGSDSFKKISNSTTKKSGDIVILDASSSYYDPISDKRTKALHSVVMTSSNNCKSKLGSFGAYKTSLADMKSYYGAASTRTYRKK